MNYKVAYAHGEMNPKKRHTMEDVHRVVPVLPDFPLYSYFGVYDGENLGRIAMCFFHLYLMPIFFQVMEADK
jgi:hypothetical protein